LPSGGENSKFVSVTNEVNVICKIATKIISGHVVSIAVQQYITHTDHCQNLNSVPSLISFTVFPRFKYIIRHLVKSISISTMVEEELW